MPLLSKVTILFSVSKSRLLAIVSSISSFAKAKAIGFIGLNYSKWYRLKSPKTIYSLGSIKSP